MEMLEDQLDLAEKLVDERFDFIESIKKEKKLDGEEFNYQDEANVYFTIKIAQLIKRIEYLESKIN